MRRFANILAILVFSLPLLANELTARKVLPPPQPKPSSHKATAQEVLQMLRSGVVKPTKPIHPADLIDNGAGRGGGNGIVCFAHDSPWIERLRVSTDPVANKPLPVPDEALGDIESIQMIDLQGSLLDAKEHHEHHYIPPETQIDQITLEQAAAEPAISGALLEYEFERYQNRYLGVTPQEYVAAGGKIKAAIPSIFKKLLDAREALPLSSLEISDVAVPQTSDYLEWNLPRDCVVTTLINQWKDPDTNTYRWITDGRLFFHPTHSFASQVAALLHERTYWIAREVMFVPSRAWATYYFAGATMIRETTYREALKHFNGLFFDSYAMFVSFQEIGPLAWFNDLWQRMASQAAGQTEVRVLEPIYTKSFRDEVLHAPMVDDATRREADKNLRYYLRNGKYDPVKLFRDGFPANFNSSQLPIP